MPKNIVTQCSFKGFESFAITGSRAEDAGRAISPDAIRFLADGARVEPGRFVVWSTHGMDGEGDLGVK